MSVSKNDHVQVHKITSRKSLFASGAFGQVSIALGVTPEPEHRRFSIHYLAIKEIRNAIYIKKDDSSKPYSSSVAHSFHDEHWDPLEPKDVLLQSYEFAQEVFCELSALRILSEENHPCITPLLSVLETDHDPFSLSLVFPYGLIDLATVIELQRKSLKFIQETLLKTIMDDILSALDFCHSKGIIHKDVKPGNFIVSQNGHIQLTDFGLAKAWTQHACIIDAKNPSYTECSSRSRSNAQCTLHYRPPELLFNAEEYGYEVDIWGCGLILAELINLCPLFPGRAVYDQIGRIFYILGSPNQENWADAERLDDYRKFCYKPQEGIGLVQAIPRTFGNTCMSEFLMNMLSLDPRKRLSASHCRSHLWFYNDPSPSPRSHVFEYLVPPQLRVSKTWLDTVPFEEETNLPLVLEYHSEMAMTLAAARHDIATSNLQSDDDQQPINLSHLAEILTNPGFAES